MEISIPSSILMLMERLEAAGFQGWAVGGCVRDRILGREPHDWDLCTDALPAQTAAVFSDFPQYHSGEKHGTVAVIVNGEPVEITTFRAEGDYRDHRRPGWVEFRRDIADDLARRDFTVNAMAYRPASGLCDPFGGQRDLEAKVLRAVGQPRRRFEEDGLRILRGVRFGARFGLTPEKDTLEAMKALAPTLSLQARERVYGELCGYLPYADAENLLTYRDILRHAIPELGPLMGFQQHNYHHAYDVFTHTAHVVAGCGPDLCLRWAALLHDVGKPGRFTMDEKGVGHFKGHAALGAQMADGILQGLHAPNALRQEVCALIAHHGSTRDFGRLPTDKPVRRLLRKLGETTTRRLLALDLADEQGKGRPPELEPFRCFEARLDAILAEKPCLRISDLSIGGRDLAGMGVPKGPIMGKILTALFDRVSDGELQNDAAILLPEARRLWEEFS